MKHLNLPFAPLVYISGILYDVVSRTTANDCPDGDLRTYLLKMNRAIIYLRRKRGKKIYRAWEFPGQTYSKPVENYVMEVL